MTKNKNELEKERESKQADGMQKLRDIDDKRKTVVCRQCGTKMRKKRKTESSSSGQLLGCAVFLVGFMLLFVFPVGTIIGLLLILGAAGMGVKRKKGMFCPNCKYFFETT